MFSPAPPRGMEWQTVRNGAAAHLKQSNKTKSGGTAVIARHPLRAIQTDPLRNNTYKQLKIAQMRKVRTHPSAPPAISATAPRPSAADVAA